MSNPTPDNRPYVFIITYGRSGSTVLKNVLNSIDGYHIKGENWNALYPIYRSFQVTRHAYLQKGQIALGPDDPWYGADKFNPERYTKRLLDIFVEEVLQPPAEARVLGFKEIRYFQVFDEFDPFLRFIRQFFVSAKFIFNSRPSEQVIVSKWWANMDPEKVSLRLKAMDERFANYTAENPDYAFHLHHPEWSDNPAAFKPLMDFLGEAYDEEKIADILNRRLTH